MWLDGRDRALTSVSAIAGEWGIAADGFLPRPDLRASVAQRRALGGLLDVAGGVDAAGAVMVSVASRPAARDLYELLSTLGISAAMSVGPVRGADAPR